MTRCTRQLSVRSAALLSQAILFWCLPYLRGISCLTDLYLLIYWKDKYFSNATIDAFLFDSAAQQRLRWHFVRLLERARSNEIIDTLLLFHRKTRMFFHISRLALVPECPSQLLVYVGVCSRVGVWICHLCQSEFFLCIQCRSNILPIRCGIAFHFRLEIKNTQSSLHLLSYDE